MAVYSSLLSISAGLDRTIQLGRGSGNALGLADLQLLGSTSGALDMLAAATTTPYTITWPSAQGSGNLNNNGSGVLSWVAAASGTVTSVSQADGSTTPIFTYSGSPVTTSGTLTQTLSTQAANTVFAGATSGGSAQPGFRALVVADIPSLSSLYLALTGGTMSGAINMGANQINNLANGVAASDAATYGQLLSVLAGLSWKNAVLVATTANITLSGEQTIDGFLTSSSRVLVKNQTTQANNGIYVSASGAWTRATDMNSWAQVPGTVVVAQEGTVNGDLAFICTSAPGGTLGTTAIIFGPFGTYLADGSTLSLTGNIFSIANGGVGTTQLAAGAVTAAKLGTVTDGITLDQSGSGSTIEIKSGGVGTTQLANAAVTAAKLGSVTDGVTVDQSGAGSTIEVLNAPAIKRILVAGQTFTANTSYAVRWGLTSNGETAGRVYAADISTGSFDLFYVIGMASSAAGVSAGGNITVTQRGDFALSSADTAFSASTDGLAIFLQTGGTLGSTPQTAPSSSGQAITRLGIIKVRSATNTSCIIDVNAVPVGVN